MAPTSDLDASPSPPAYEVRWSSADAEYVATTTRFASLSWLHADPVEALRGLVALVADAEAAMGMCDEAMALRAEDASGVVGDDFWSRASAHASACDCARDGEAG